MLARSLPPNKLVVVVAFSFRSPFKDSAPKKKMTKHKKVKATRRRTSPAEGGTKTKIDSEMVSGTFPPPRKANKKSINAASRSPLKDLARGSLSFF
jgi:hypothetical protein